MTADEQRKMVLLEGAVREILRIADASKSDATSVPIDAALDGQLGREWRAIERRARALVGGP